MCLRLRALHVRGLRPAVRCGSNVGASRLHLRRALCVRCLQLRLTASSELAMDSIQAWVVAVAIGIAATAVMDLWLLAVARLGIPTTDWRLVGRWVASMRQGRFAHASVAQAPAMRFELALGWLTHYAVGIAYALMLVAFTGAQWLAQPAVLPALAFGLASVVMPLFVMQPAMGAGFAAAKTATPWRNRLRALANHGVFGLGLYLGAAAIAVLFT
jgi:hypothetical protein